MDASGHVASYSKGLVESKNGLVVGTNSPTREFDAEHAYVVNISELLTAEAQDIITFEQNTLGLTGHASAEEYALQKLPIENSITNHYGGGSKNLWYPMLQTLAGVCYLLNDAGDERDDRGVSAFKSAITLLKHECDLEIRKLTKQRMMFSMLEYLPLAPLPFIGVLKWFFTTYMPGTSVIYNGMIGYISQTLIILIAIFAYWYITSTNSPTAIRRNDRSDFVDAFLYWPPFQRILPNILPKKARTKLKIEKELKGALSSKDIKYIYASKVLAAGIAFVMTLTALTAFTFLAKEFTYDNIKTASFLGGSDMSVEDARKWHELDNSLLAQPKAPRERDLQDIIPSYFPDISAMDLKDQCNRIIQKYNNYHALSFHWWYVLIAYGLGVFGWFAPGIMLDLRKKMVRAEEEEDVLQLQTMLARAPSSTVLVTALSSNIDDLHPDNLSIGMQIRIGGYISFHGKGLHVLYMRTLREGGIEDAG